MLKTFSSFSKPKKNLLKQIHAFEYISNLKVFLPTNFAKKKMYENQNFNFFSKLF
jgi:hypothetical protein